MIARLYNSPTFAAESKAISDGINAHCPFCRARRSDQPEAGKHILFLHGTDAGQSGIVINEPSNYIRYDQFLVRMGHNSTDESRIVTLGKGEFIVEPFGEAPHWMVPLSMEDAFVVHEACLEMLDKFSMSTKALHAESTLFPIIGTCWWRRLPLTADDIWPMLKAHGVEGIEAREFGSLFDFGFQLLTAVNGRTPIKRKRMTALSKPRYHSKRQAEFWINYFGHE